MDIDTAKQPELPCMDDNRCKCSKPATDRQTDDQGNTVMYCRRCWRPIE